LKVYEKNLKSKLNKAFKLLFSIVRMKRVYIGLLLLLLIPLILGQSNFQYFYSAENFIQGLADAGASIFGPVFGHDVPNEFLFAKVLLFFMIFAIVHSVLSNIELFENRAVLFVVTIVFAIFSVRYLRPNEIINAVLLPYGVFAAAVAIFIPVFVYFYFVHNSIKNPTGRRLAWGIYLVVFLMMWGLRPYEDLGAANWIYFLGFFFILMNILFDRTIQGYFGLAGLERWRQGVEDARIGRLQVEYQDLSRLTPITGRARSRLKALERELRRNGSWSP